MLLTKLNNPDYDLRLETVDGAVVQKIYAVPMVKFKLALDQAGLLASVESFVNSLSQAAKIQWNQSTAIHIDNEFITEAVSGNHFTQAQVDAAFAVAVDL